MCGVVPFEDNKRKIISFLEPCLANYKPCSWLLNQTLLSHAIFLEVRLDDSITYEICDFLLKAYKYTIKRNSPMPMLEHVFLETLTRKFLNQ